MIPVLFEIGPFKLHSFGLMVLVAFLAGAALVTRELRRRRLEPDDLDGYPLAAIIGGLVGARVYYIAEHWSTFASDPLGSIFTSAGLTWYGGVVGGAIAVLVLAHRRGQPLWSICDAFAPGLALAYLLGRVGCQLSGDGDYGPPSDLPWAMAYPDGVVPTTVPVHPTPVYEVLMMIPVVALLWALRKRPAQPGWLFGLYLVLVGAERWLAELWRVRPDKFHGMSTAQWTSCAMVLAGLWLLARRRASREGAGNGA